MNGGSLAMSIKRVLLLGCVLVFALTIHAPVASAQLGGTGGGTDNAYSGDSGGFCDATVSGDTCMAGWFSDPFDAGTNGLPKDVPCPTASNYDTCIQKCGCEWGKAKNKCKSQLACLDIAKAEYNACTGHCITDYA
jgi:hypothetical protein